MSKKFLLFLFVSLYSLSAFSTTYYVSREGDDDNDGMSQNTPWKSLSKLALVMDVFEPGDQILFRRGDNFGGSLRWYESGTAANPITLGAYGSGANPVFTGAITVSGWQHEGGNIWRSGCRTCPEEVAGFFINGQPQQIGRTPNQEEANGGYLFYDSYQGRNQITDNDLNTSIDWTGAQAVMRTNRSLLDRVEIQNVNGNTLNFATDVSSDIREGYGYFLQHHKSTLDQQGEWFWDADRSSFYLYYEGDPNNVLAATTWYDKLLEFYDRDYITIENIDFYGSKKEMLRIGDAQGIKVSNCNFKNGGETAVYIYRSDVLFENNTIDYSNNVGLSLNDCDNAVVRNNVISNSGMFAGLGNNGYGGYEGMRISGNGINVQYNVVRNSGYTGIYFWDNGVTIQNNLIENSCMTKSGSAGIYNWDNNNDKVNRKILNNIVLHSVGAPQGTNNPNRVYADGIKLSNLSSGVEVRGNTVAYCSTDGIFVQSAKNVDITNNTVYGNGRQIWVYDSNADARTENLLIENNTFFSTEKMSRVAEYQTSRTNINGIATINNNRYARPLNPERIIRRYYKPNNWVATDHNVDFWNDLTNHDDNSSQAPFVVPAYTVTNYLSNNKVINPNFTNDLNNWERWGPGGSSNYNHNRVTGELDGGCVEYTFTSSSEDYMVGITDDLGALDAGKKYLLEFSVKGVNKGECYMVLKKDGSPYNDITERKYFNHTTNRQEVQQLMECHTTEASPRIEFRINKTSNKVWFDNFKLREVEVTYANPAEHFKLLYNPNQYPITIPVSGNFKDLNNSLVNQVVLAPYTSKIIMSTQANALPIELYDFTAEVISNNEVSLNWEVGNAENFSHFEIEKSTNSFEFMEIGQVITKDNRKNYNYLDNQSHKATNNLLYYRLKMVDLDGSFNYSPVVTVTLNEIQSAVNIFPNPAIDKVTIAIQDVSETAFAEILNLQGQRLKHTPLIDSQFNWSVSDLAPGMYVLRILDGTKVQTVEKLLIQ